jgi:hypothetical protein
MKDERRHDGPDLFVRGPIEEKPAVQRLLSDRDRQLKSFVIACFRAFVADPTGFLRVLDKHWPERRPPGRPRKEPRD